MKVVQPGKGKCKGTSMPSLISARIIGQSRYFVKLANIASTAIDIYLTFEDSVN